MLNIIYNWTVSLTTRITLRKLKKIAKRYSSFAAKLYPPAKEKNPSASEQEVIKYIFSDIFPQTEKFDSLPDKSKKRMNTCLETLNGLCYWLAIDGYGDLNGYMLVRVLQFTMYVDMELAQLGFPPPSKEQKERALEALELNLDGWEQYTGD